MKTQWYKHFFLLLGLLFTSACTTLKPYERVYVKDVEMQMGLDQGKYFQQYIFSIREAAVPAGTGRASGGCGCN